MLALAAGCGSAAPDEEPSTEKAPEPEETEYVENEPGDLVITAPARGAFVPVEAGNIVLVTGQGASSETVHVNGQPITPAADGTFVTEVVVVPGLNIIHVENGEAAVDTPVVFGAFAPNEAPVPSALNVRINERGFASDNPNVVSLELLANRVLDDYDILATLPGQVFTGSIPGGSWSLVVTSASYGEADVGLGPEPGGAAFAAQVDNVQVNGELTIDLLFTKTDSVTITADMVQVDGVVNAGLQGASIATGGGFATTSLYGFQYASGNAGLPCCVDSILTDYLKPKVETAIQDQVEGLMAQELAFALEQFALPASLDLSAVGLPAALGIHTFLDGAWFDAQGASLSAAANFMAPLEPHHIGTTAPGWITFAQPAAPPALDPAFGVSLSLDALNQALHAAWAQNGLAITLTELAMVDTVHLSPRLPPMVLPNGQGGLTAQAGEVVVDTTFNGIPIQAALSVIGEVYVELDATTQQVRLVPMPAPTVSLTWLAAEGLNEGLRNIIKAKIDEMIPTLLTPIALPLPTLPLGVIAPSFGGAVGALGPATQLAVTPEGRLDLYGDLVIW